MAFNEDISDAIDLTIDGDGADGTDNRVPLISTADFDQDFHLKARIRVDFFIWHRGLDKDDVATTDSVYVVTGDTETDAHTSWFFDNTADVTDPFLFVGVPRAEKLKLYCKSGQSVKIRYRYVIRDEGMRVRTA